MFISLAEAEKDSRSALADLFGADYSGSAITPQRSDHAPYVVRSSLKRLAAWDARDHTNLADWSVIDHGDVGALRATTWDDAFKQLYDAACAVHKAERFVIGLGGDHSVSWPLIKAATDERLNTKRGLKQLGVIQLDVHHDVRPLDHGASNGTPMRGLIESSVLRSSDLVQIGIHPFANARLLTEYCDEQDIRRISLDELERYGAEQSARIALAHLSHCDAIYLTVDIDVLDRAFAPGTGAALSGGLTPRALHRIVETVATDPRTIAMDVVEFDPERDVAGITAAACAMVVMTALSAVAKRTN